MHSPGELTYNLTFQGTTTAKCDCQWRITSQPAPALWKGISFRGNERCRRNRLLNNPQPPPPKQSWPRFINSARHLPAIIIALAQRTLAVPVLYLSSPLLSLADVQSTVFRGISLPKRGRTCRLPLSFCVLMMKRPGWRCAVRFYQVLAIKFSPLQTQRPRWNSSDASRSTWSLRIRGYPVLLERNSLLK